MFFVIHKSSSKGVSFFLPLRVEAILQMLEIPLRMILFNFEYHLLLLFLFMGSQQLEESYFNQIAGAWCFIPTPYGRTLSPFKIRRNYSNKVYMPKI